MAGIPRTIPEVIRKAIAGALQDVHVALPGTVQRWDATANLADVQVSVKHPVFDDDNDRSFEDMGVLLGVPVMFPRAGGYLLSVPLTAGDSGLLVFNSTAIGEWRSTGQTSEPHDASRHSIGWPVFIPGLFADAAPLAQGDASARATSLILGKDGDEKQIRIGSSGILLGASSNEHVTTIEAVALLIYNTLVALCASAGGGPLTAAILQPLLGAAVTTALTAQAAPAPAGAIAQGTANTAAQAGFVTGTAPVNTLMTAWVAQFAALSSKTPDASALFPSLGSSVAKTE